MRKRNREVGNPVFRAVLPKGQEHRLEERAALVASFKLFWRDVEPPYLKTQTVDQLVRATTLAEAGEVLVEQRLA